jgi:glycosyltransferase involved in cell wall biosynthesis
LNTYGDKPLTKILHIITRLDMGGSAQNTLLTCRELSDRYEMVLVHGLSLESNMTDSEKRMVQKGIDAAKTCGVRFVCMSSLVRRIRPVKDFRGLCALIWLLINEKPFVVHTHSSKAGILGRLAAILTRIPIIIHTPHGHVFFGHFGLLASKLFLWIEKWFAFLTDRIIALTEGEKEDYLKLSVGRPDKLITVHSGVDIQQFSNIEINVNEKKQTLGLLPNEFLVGFVGWLLPIKGPMHLLRAMASVWIEHPGVTLVVVGKGDLDVDLRAEALQLNADGRIKFLGWRDDIDEIMQIFDVLVLPSLNEGMGRVLVEAMAAGKPVIASNIGGIPDLVKHGHTGILVPPADEANLAGAIVRLVSNPKEARRMGELARIHSQRFSLETMIEKIDAIYDDLIFSPKKIIKLKPVASGSYDSELTDLSSSHQTLQKSIDQRALLKSAAAGRETKPN